nr:MAG TPA_asm: hypothetical protein [Bacteriophage sp.]
MYQESDTCELCKSLRTSYMKHICKSFYVRFKTFKQLKWISYPQDALERLRTHRNSFIQDL